MPRGQGKAPVQPVKETAHNFRHTGCKKTVDVSISHIWWWHWLSNALSPRCKDWYQYRKWWHSISLPASLYEFPVMFRLDVIISSLHNFLIILLFLFCLSCIYFELWISGGFSLNKKEQNKDYSNSTRHLPLWWTLIMIFPNYFIIFYDFLFNYGASYKIMQSLNIKWWSSNSENSQLLCFFF